MDARWQALEDAGLPAGAVRVQSAHPAREPMREAVRHWSAAPDELDAWQREPLLAWLRGFRHHFPTAFAAELGESGTRLIEALEARGYDANRYLKLRRIAIENLCAWL